MNPIRTSLRYPQVTLVLAGMLFAVGLIALFTMPRREDPKITIRTGLVSAIYPGATSAEVENQVTRKIEERLFRFSEVRREKTFSTTRNGVVIFNVELNESVQDADGFWSRLRLGMAQLKYELPDGVQGPVVDSDFGDTVAVLIGVHSENYDYRDLKDYAQRIETTLRALPDVSKIERIGDQKEQIVLSESQQKLAQYGVNPQHVVQAIEAHGAVQYAGLIPTASSKVPLDADGHFSSEDELRNLVVDISPSGIPIYLKDIGTINRVYEDPSEYVRVNGQKTILLAVEMHDGKNIVTFGHDLQTALDRVQKTLPPDVHLDLIANQPRVVADRVGDFFREFGIAIAAVILVTMLLLPMRVALVASIAIPVTVSITFALLNMAGIELHQVSIAALIVVLGMVVDDAIVIADNYVELLDRKMPRDEAAWRCASEMAVPVLTATITIIASFAPLLLLTGSTGEFIRALPITVSIALATSFVVAMLLTPLTARFFIRQGLHDHSVENAQHKTSAIEYMQRYYNRAITWSMQNRRMVLISAVIIFFVGIGVLQLVKQQFFPLAERDQFVMDVWLPEGTRIEATEAAVRKIEKVVQSQALVKNCASFVGTSAPRFYYNVNPQPPAENYAQILVNTASVAETPKIVERLRKQMPFVVPETKVFVKELQQGDDMDAPIEVRISGDDDVILRSLANQVDSILRHTPGASYIDTDWHDAQLQTQLHLNDEVAGRLGFTHTSIAQQLGAGFDGVRVSTYWEGDRNIDIALRLSSAERQNYESVTDAYVQSPTTGVSMPLSAVATLSPEWQSGRIVHRDGVRTITVHSFADDGYLPSQVLASARKQIAKIALPDGYHIEYGGEEENQDETSGEMDRALAISLVLIFLTLLFQFRTLVDPLIVMAAFPLALPGAALGLFLTRNPFGFTAFIGIISLGGLVVRNSIILIDAIHERMKAGTPLVQAALEAGERRLRPIFLTTMAAAVGVTPMILSGSSLWSPMASVIAFGLLGSMFFTLIVIPVLFVAVYEKRAAHSASMVTALLIISVAFCGQAQAETRNITLDEAIRLAHSQNKMVHLANLKIDEAKAKLTQARADYFPVVSNQTDAMHLGEKENLTIPKGALGTYPSDGAIPGKDVSISLGKQDLILSTTTAAQPLSQLLKIHAGVSAAHADTAIARADAQHAEDEVTLNVKKIYYNLLGLEKRIHAVELRIHAGEDKIAEARDAVQAGSALDADVQQGVAEIAEARHALGVLQDAEDDLRVDLNELIGLPLETEIQLSDPLQMEDELPDAPSVAKTSSVDLSTIALAHNPEIASAHSTLDKANADLKAAHYDFIPDVSAYVEHVYQNGVPLLPENSITVGLRVNWTLSEFGKRTGKVRELQSQVAQARENLSITQDRVRIDAEKQLRKVRRSISALDAAQANVAARAEMRRIISDQVSAKTANTSTLSDAEEKLAEAQSQLFDVRVEQATAKAELDKLLGAAISEGGN
ncbi:efflux RND transporter permease subunit [Telmatobacter bradus]|uniref:efflux RND transporter permease subunit n=1 Tax=Telmatobacter bradus TaxID=474953 RepID=UPI003B437652